MSAVVVLGGSALGFVAALGAFLFLEVSLLGALGIWAASGPAAALLTLVVTLLPAQSAAATEPARSPAGQRA